MSIIIKKKREKDEPGNDGEIGYFYILAVISSLLFLLSLCSITHFFSSGSTKAHTEVSVPLLHLSSPAFIEKRLLYSG